jgi:hypothetical protein
MRAGDSRKKLNTTAGFGVKVIKAEFHQLPHAHGTQALNLWAVRGAQTPMNIRLAPSLEYYCMGGLYLLRTLDITTNHSEIQGYHEFGY